MSAVCLLLRCRPGRVGVGAKGDQLRQSALSSRLSGADQDTDAEWVVRLDKDSLRMVARCAFTPLRIIIIFAQVTSQFGSVFHITYPPGMTALANSLRIFVDVWSAFFNAECAGLGDFHTQWLLRVIGLPVTATVIIAIRWGVGRKGNAATAAEQAKADGLLAVFLLCKYMYIDHLCGNLWCDCVCCP